MNIGRLHEDYMYYMTTRRLRTYWRSSVQYLDVRSISSISFFLFAARSWHSNARAIYNSSFCRLTSSADSSWFDSSSRKAEGAFNSLHEFSEREKLNGSATYDCRSFVDVSPPTPDSTYKDVGVNGVDELHECKIRGCVITELLLRTLYGSAGLRLGLCVNKEDKCCSCDTL